MTIDLAGRLSNHPKQRTLVNLSNIRVIVDAPLARSATIFFGLIAGIVAGVSHANVIDIGDLDVCERGGIAEVGVDT